MKWRSEATARDAITNAGLTRSKDLVRNNFPLLDACTGRAAALLVVAIAQL
jgi:hypothetical protein